MSEPVMISIYLPDMDELYWWTSLFATVDFRHTDWCEMTSEGRDERITYGPTEVIPPYWKDEG